MSETAEHDLAQMTALVIDALEELKGRDIVCLDVSGLTDVMDAMVVVTGTSRRHVGALADNLVERAKAAGMRPAGMEGDAVSGWILVDFVDVVVHLMSEEMRAFYQLEKLWTASGEE